MPFSAAHPTYRSRLLPTILRLQLNLRLPVDTRDGSGPESLRIDTSVVYADNRTSIEGVK